MELTTDSRAPKMTNKLTPNPPLHYYLFRSRMSDLDQTFGASLWTRNLSVDDERTPTPLFSSSGEFELETRLVHE